MLKFDPDTHTYSIDGNKIPSVTQILSEWVEIPRYYVNTFTGAMVRKDVFDAGGDHGTAIHTACNLILEGGGHDALDWEALNPELCHPLQQFERWLADYKPKIASVEEPMYSSKYGYAGTPDIAAKVQRKMAVIDIKTGAYSMAGPQTSAYEQLYKEASGHGRNMKRYVLYLPKTGDYKFIPMTNKNDWDFFRSRLFQYQYLNS